MKLMKIIYGGAVFVSLILTVISVYLRNGMGIFSYRDMFLVLFVSLFSSFLSVRILEQRIKDERKHTNGSLWLTSIYINLIAYSLYVLAYATITYYYMPEQSLIGSWQGPVNWLELTLELPMIVVRIILIFGWVTVIFGYGFLCKAVRYNHTH